MVARETLLELNEALVGPHSEIAIVVDCKETRIELPMNFFSVMARNEWNQLPVETASRPSLEGFKAGLDKRWPPQHFDIFKFT